MSDELVYAVAIIKPDAHKDVLAEMILEDFREGGFAVIKRKDIRLSEAQALKIYSLDGANPKLGFAAKSLVGDSKNPNATLVILKSIDGEPGARKRANDLKGKADSGGIRSKYRLMSRADWDAAGIVGDRLSEEISKNRLHISDTDEASLDILNMLLDNEEKVEIMAREPELYREMNEYRLADELKKQLVEVKKFDLK